MISTVTTTTVTTVTTVTAAGNAIGEFTLVSAIALVGYLGIREVMASRRGKSGSPVKYLYISVVPLSIAFVVWAAIKVLSAVRL